MQERIASAIVHAYMPIADAIRSYRFIVVCGITSEDLISHVFRMFDHCVGRVVVN